MLVVGLTLASRLLTCATGTVAILVTMVVLAACGGGKDSGGRPMRATLTPDGCVYEGDTSPAPGVFTVEVKDQTPESARFDLHEMADDATIEEIERLYAWASKDVRADRAAALGIPAVQRATALASRVQEGCFGHVGRPRRYVAPPGE